MELKIKKLHPKAILPTYGSAGAAGADLYALPEGDPITISDGSGGNRTSRDAHPMDEEAQTSLVAGRTP